MEQAPYETVELTRAESGTELWPAIEAAQFARLIRAEEPEGDEERAALERFVAALGRCIEEWEATQLEARATTLGELGTELGQLRAAGLSVHWATVEREFETEQQGEVRLPVAIVLISRLEHATTTVMVPLELEAEA